MCGWVWWLPRTEAFFSGWLLIMNIQNLTLDSSKVVGFCSYLDFLYIIIIFHSRDMISVLLVQYRIIFVLETFFFLWLPSHHGSGPILSARSSKSNDLPNLNDSAAKEPHVGLPVNTRLKRVFRKLECHMNYGQDIYIYVILHDISLY